MNLENTINLLGQLQTILGVLNQLPDECRKTTLGTLASNGLDVRLITRNAVKAKHGLQEIPRENFEPLVAISTAHLPLSVRETINDKCTHNWGTVLYDNEFGAFLAITQEMVPTEAAPAAVKAIYTWAADRGICWVKFDADAASVAGLPCYGDGDAQITEDDFVLSA